jgi:hypothetical protein
MKSAARSPIMVAGACVLQVGMIGITDASATVSPSSPRTASLLSTTAVEEGRAGVADKIDSFPPRKPPVRRGEAREQMRIGGCSGHLDHGFDRDDHRLDVRGFGEEVRLDFERAAGPRFQQPHMANAL